MLSLIVFMLLPFSHSFISLSSTLLSTLIFVGARSAPSFASSQSFLFAYILLSLFSLHSYFTFHESLNKWAGSERELIQKTTRRLQYLRLFRIFIHRFKNMFLFRGPTSRDKTKGRAVPCDCEFYLISELQPTWI